MYLNTEQHEAHLGFGSVANHWTQLAELNGTEHAVVFSCNYGGVFWTPPPPLPGSGTVRPASSTSSTCHLPAACNTPAKEWNLQNSHHQSHIKKKNRRPFCSFQVNVRVERQKTKNQHLLIQHNNQTAEWWQWSVLCFHYRGSMNLKSTHMMQQ